MGGGGSKKKAKPLDQPDPQRAAPVPETKDENLARSPSLRSHMQSRPASPPTSPQELHVTNPSPFVNISRPPSVHSRVSVDRSIVGQANGTTHRISIIELDDNTPRESADMLLPPINNAPSVSKSRSSRRQSSVMSSPSIKPPRKNSTSSTASSAVVPPPPIKTSSRKNSSTSSVSHTHSHGSSTHSKHGQAGHCSHCPHCQRLKGRIVTSSPKPKWIIDGNPGHQSAHILMDDYDIEAVKKKVIAENGHLPGAYDYQPQLIMEPEDYDLQNEHYYTQPLVAKTSPRVVPTRTPFPEWDVLQRREQRLNKPYTLPLFVE